MRFNTIQLSESNLWTISLAMQSKFYLHLLTAEYSIVIFGFHFFLSKILFNMFLALLFVLPWNVSDKWCPIWADTVDNELCCWGAGHWLSVLMCFPLVSTCLRRLRAGSTTWLLLCLLLLTKVCWTCFFTLSMPPQELSSSLASVVWAWCPLIMWPNDGVTALGDTNSWQPFPLMATAELPQAHRVSWPMTRLAPNRKVVCCSYLQV